MKPSLDTERICFQCEKGLPWLKRPVIRLQPSSWPQIPLQIHGLFNYQGPIDEWIWRCKYKGDLSYAALIGDLMAKYLPMPAQTPDYIIPLPLHPSRQRERGFNQTLEIARQVQKKIGIPIDAVNCKKIRHTASQSHINARRRRQNIKPEYFAIGSALMGKKVLIIEDVVTTGSTVRALCIALKMAGVKKIDIWTCCRTEKKP